MINTPTITVKIKPEVLAMIDETIIAYIHLRTAEKISTIKTWVRTNSEKLTQYAMLLALSETLDKPIEALLDIKS